MERRRNRSNSLKVALLSNKWFKYGGWPSYTWHLREGLKAVGCEVDVYSPMSPTGHHKWVSKLKKLKTLDEYDVVHVVVCPTKDSKVLNHIMNMDNVLVTIHDPTELDKVTMMFLTESKHPIVCIRKSMLSHEKINKLRFAMFVPHPYKRESSGKVTGSRIIATSRVDYDKNTHMILEANCGIEIVTNHINRIYDYHVLQGIKNYPHYKKRPDTMKETYKNAMALVDVSTIKGDGGGTQYTFLEAMDYGLTLIMHESWSTGKDDELVKGKHYIPISSATQLKRVCKSITKTDNRKLYSNILKTHDFKSVAEQYITIYKNILKGNLSNFNQHRKAFKNKRHTSGIGQFLKKGVVND